MQPHIVHLDAPTFRAERTKTFDAARGDKAEPDGHDQAPPFRRINPETLEVETVVPDPIPYWGFDEQVRDSAPPPADCPDCGTGLASLGHDLVCMRLGRKLKDLPVDQHDHQCVIACGGD